MTSSATDQFADLAQTYGEMAHWPFRRDLELPSVFDVLGDLAGLDVLDYGCGEGTYCRLLKSCKARTVVGFDPQAGMLNGARSCEQAQPLGIEYVDQLAQLQGRHFDLVLAVYVLPYAADVDELGRMCVEMAGLLKPGGRLVTLPVHPAFNSTPGYYSKYGFDLSWAGDDPRHTAVTLRLLRRDPPCTIDARCWSYPDLEQALGKAHFTSIVHTWPSVPRVPLTQAEREHLHDYLAAPHAVITQCVLGPTEVMQDGCPVASPGRTPNAGTR
jgi:SAM-dependent methyltransferase